MSWKKYFRPVNSVLPVSYDSAGAPASSVSKFSSWLPEFYQGPSNRLLRYMQYEQMDLDHEVSAALDTIADFSTHQDEELGVPFQINYLDEATPSEKEVLSRSLRLWCNLNEFDRRIFRIFRSTLMYGDQFFVRDPETYKLHWIDPSTVDRVLVNESQGKKIEVYFVRDLDLNLKAATATNVTRKNIMGYNSADTIFPNAPYTGQASGAVGSGSGVGSLQGAAYAQAEAFPVDANHIVHLSLTEGMTNSWPFGISILEKIFKVYKQKELLEDAILIYRVHRAPERRVFFIDTGTMPPNKAAQYLERVRYEVQQKRIPSRTGGGQNITDSSYNPMSMLEDYFFAVTSEGRGSKVDTLPGGENLGQIDDLRYFNNKMLRALGVPSGYLPTGPEDGSNTYNDGRIGAAFIQEFRFSRLCRRYQKLIISTLDEEFKLYLKKRGVVIDSSMFTINFNEPQSFSEYRQLELDTAYANLYSSVSGIKTLSKRFAMKRYLGLTEDEIAKNERMWREENGTTIPTEDDEVGGGLRDLGIRPGAPDEFDLGGDEMGGDEIEGDLGGDEMGGDMGGDEGPEL